MTIKEFLKVIVIYSAIFCHLVGFYGKVDNNWDNCDDVDS